MKYSKDKFQKNFIFENEHSKTFCLCLLPGQAISPHQHPGHQLQVMVIEGKGKVCVNDKEELFSEGDIVRCHADDFFSLKNCSEDNLCCLATMFKV